MNGLITRQYAEWQVDMKLDQLSDILNMIISILLSECVSCLDFSLISR